MTGTTIDRITPTETLQNRNSNAQSHYRLVPRRLGCEVHGVDLKKDLPQEVIESIKEDTAKHRILIFKEQGVIDGDRHVQIAKWFGEPDSPFDRHPKAPNGDVFRVSNDIKEGLTQIGICWHIDATFQNIPFGYSLYHMDTIYTDIFYPMELPLINFLWVKIYHGIRIEKHHLKTKVTVPKDGPTQFTGLSDIVQGLSPEKLERWDRLYMCSDRHERPIHPLIFTHPRINKKGICFNALMIDSFVWDYGKDNERYTDSEETRQIIEEVNEEFNKSGNIYSHMWKEGEFIISDNLSVGHLASYESTLDIKKIGLRVLHRVSTKGVHKLTK